MHSIQRAAQLLKDDKLVAMPTETVYGLAGNALSDNAVAAIYAAKGRPQFNPLIVHVRSLDDAMRYAQFSEEAQAVAKRFWPGPLTLVLPRRKDCALSLLVSAGLESVALRVPAHPVAQALLEASGLPIAAPSANRSGRISPTRAEHVQEELGDRVAMILDGGACDIGIESTVVSFMGATPKILRPGSVTGQMLGYAVDTSGGVQAPGMLASHYAPECKMRLNATSLRPGEVLLAFGAQVPHGALVCENLSVKGDTQEAAANLFRMLRALDASEADCIAVMPVPEEGLGAAINDRLRRGASSKILPPPEGGG